MKMTSPARHSFPPGLATEVEAGVSEEDFTSNWMPLGPADGPEVFTWTD